MGLRLSSGYLAWETKINKQINKKINKQPEIIHYQYHTHYLEGKEPINLLWQKRDLNPPASTLSTQSLVKTMHLKMVFWTAHISLSLTRNVMLLLKTTHCEYGSVTTKQIKTIESTKLIISNISAIRNSWCN